MKSETRGTLLTLATEMQLFADEERSKEVDGFAKRLEVAIASEPDVWTELAGQEPPTFPISFADWEPEWTSGERKAKPPTADSEWFLVATTGDMQCLWVRRRQK